MQLPVCTGDIYPQDTALCQLEIICRACLNGGRTEGKQLISGSFGVSVHVDQNVDSILVNTIGCFAIARDLEEKRYEFQLNVVFF